MGIIWSVLIIGAIAAIAIAIRLGLRKTKCEDCEDCDESIFSFPVSEDLVDELVEIELPEEPEPIFDESDTEEVSDVSAEVDEEAFKSFPIPELEKIAGSEDSFGGNDSFDIGGSDFGSGLED